MDENTKLYVFDKKEIALIFLFLLLSSATSFVLGIKVGKNFSFTQAGITNEDVKKVEMLSTQEEEVNKALKESNDATQVPGNEALKDMSQKSLDEKLKEELAKEEERLRSGNQAVTPTAVATALDSETPVQDSFEIIDPRQEAMNREIVGAEKKFTVQLGSHRSREDAESFANGFLIRGYTPIIREVKLDNGTWYRVSLGTFDSVTDAKDYVIKEKALFQGQDYVIVKFE